MMAEEEPLVSDDAESGCCSSEESDDSEGGATPPSRRPLVSGRERLRLAAGGAAVAASSCALLVALPLAAAASGGGATCPPLLPAAAAAALLLWPLALAARLRRPRPRPTSLVAVARPGALQAAAAALFVAAVEGDRVLCHLQVPLLASGLAFAVAFYFLVCRKVVSLKRILSGMVVLLGVFVSVDYQLCNEFRCRGGEVPPAQLRGTFWTWGGHLAWAAAYVGAVALWALSCALLENHFVRAQARTSPLLVSTVERLAASETPAEPPLKPQPGAAATPGAAAGRWRDALEAAAALSTVQLATLGFIAGLTAIAQSVKDPEGALVWWWRPCWCQWLQPMDCGWAGWATSAAYAFFLVATCHLVSATESSLFGQAAAAAALPLTGLWWSVFVAEPDGSLRLRPQLTGDLVCALLGLPIVAAGLNMLSRSHWAEQRRLRIAAGEDT